MITSDDTMRGLFFIVKGQYRKGIEPSFTNKATGEISWVGGYDPNNDQTENWYMILDKETFHCVGCGSDLKKVSHGAYTQIKKWKGSLKRYLKYVSDTTSDDTYEVRYLHHAPLNHDQRTKKAEGRCPRVSPAMRCLYQAIYDNFGEHFSDLVEEWEDIAYQELKEDTPLGHTKKIMQKKVLKKVPVEEKKEKKVLKKSPVENSGKKLVKPKVKLGLKKLSMS